MNTVLINQIASRVKAQHTSVDSLWQNEQTAWQQLGWSKAQVSLWLASLPKKNQQAEPKAAYHVTPDLAHHLITLLTQAGKPLPIALLLKKLPAGVTATEQQLRKLAQQNERLALKGPLITLSD
tara:strand:+ start:13587 stop:13958 length:372 start_codon:yes stop_codon:yes gene_type:complete